MISLNGSELSNYQATSHLPRRRHEIVYCKYTRILRSYLEIQASKTFVYSSICNNINVMHHVLFVYLCHILYTLQIKYLLVKCFVYQIGHMTGFQLFYVNRDATRGTGNSQSFRNT